MVRGHGAGHRVPDGRGPIRGVVGCMRVGSSSTHPLATWPRFSARSNWRLSRSVSGLIAVLTAKITPPRSRIPAMTAASPIGALHRAVALCM